MEIRRAGGTYPKALSTRERAGRVTQPAGRGEVGAHFKKSFTGRGEAGYKTLRGGPRGASKFHAPHISASDAKTVHYAAESRKKSSDQTYIDDDEDSDFRLIYLINSGNNSKALFRVISRKLILD